MIKIRKLFSAFLCFIVLFSFPTVASANAPYTLSADLYYDDTYVENAQTIGATSADVFSNWGYDILKSARIDAIVPFDLKKGDTLTLSFNVSNHSHYESITPKYYYFQETSTGAKLTYNSWSFDSVEYSSGKGVIKLTAIQDFLSTGNNQLHIGVEFNCDCSCTDVAEFHIRNIDFNKETAETIQSNSVLSWFQRLFDKIGNGFTELKVKIETTISSLSSNIDSWGQSIVNWFSSIGKQLSDIKSSIKTWFNGLGNQISGFFDGLWNNITSKVNEVEEKIKSFWEDTKQWFKDLFVPDSEFFTQYRIDIELWFSEHFGILYQSIAIIIAMFDGLALLYSGVYTADPTVTIPDITIHVNGEDLMIINSFDFNLAEIASSGFPQLMYEFYLTVVYIYCSYWVVMYCYRKYLQLLEVHNEYTTMVEERGTA